MNLTKKSIASAVASGALLMNAFATTAFAADTVQISGNGAGSLNTATATSSNETTLVQDNSANITNNVSTSANTGGNDANANTGGSVAINTGNSATGVTLSNAANQNIASLPCGGCVSGGNAQVLISGNGAHSDNLAAVSSTNDAQLFQNNDAYISNYVDTHANTGYNDANANTGAVGGNSSVSINTGNTVAQVGIQNAANSNQAVLGSGSGAGAGSLSAAIAGNGADSYNTALLTNTNSLLLQQGNYADFYNWVDNYANTGKNDANANTGGSVGVHTGSAGSAVAIDNHANFNAADVSCGCLVGNGTSALISGNGAHSDSLVSTLKSNVMDMFQNNDSLLNNNADSDASTGYNDSNANTGSYLGGSSFSTTTGGTTSLVGITNHSNKNIIGAGATLPLPGGMNLAFQWNLAALWASMLH